MSKEIEQLKQSLLEIQERLTMLEKEENTLKVKKIMLPALGENNPGYTLYSKNFEVAAYRG